MSLWIALSFSGGSDPYLITCTLQILPMFPPELKGGPMFVREPRKPPVFVLELRKASMFMPEPRRAPMFFAGAVESSNVCARACVL